MKPKTVKLTQSQKNLLTRISRTGHQGWYSTIWAKQAHAGKDTCPCCQSITRLRWEETSNLSSQEKNDLKALVRKKLVEKLGTNYYQAAFFLWKQENMSKVRYNKCGICGKEYEEQFPSNFTKHMKTHFPIKIVVL